MKRAAAAGADRNDGNGDGRRRLRAELAATDGGGHGEEGKEVGRDRWLTVSALASSRRTGAAGDGRDEAAAEADPGEGNGRCGSWAASQLVPTPVDEVVNAGDAPGRIGDARGGSWARERRRGGDGRIGASSG
jgi:hypothetical protein